MTMNQTACTHINSSTHAYAVDGQIDSGVLVASGVSGEWVAVSYPCDGRAPLLCICQLRVLLVNGR